MDVHFAKVLIFIAMIVEVGVARLVAPPDIRCLALGILVDSIRSVAQNVRKIKNYWIDFF